MDFETVRGDFPVKRNMIYLNNASIGALSNRVIRAVNILLEDVRDHGRLHYPDWCRTADTSVKDRIGQLIGAHRDEIAFVKNTTEGILLVAHGLDWRSGDNVIIADVEYPSNVYCWMNLERRGVAIKWVKSRAGRILIEDVEALIDAQTRLISLSAVQFSNGFRLDLEQLSEVAARRNVLINLDAIQWVGAVNMDLSRYHVDFISVGGHKWLLGPIGTGFFYCRRASLDRLHPHNVGYHSVDKSEDHLDYELKFRPGAARFEEALVNFPGIWGLDAAVQTLLELGMARVEEYIFGLRRQAREGLEAKGYEIVSPAGQPNESGILSFRHPTIAADELYRRLAEKNVNVAIRAGSLRMSASFYNDADEIATFLAALP